MKRKIRKNVFETNSSSTHAICIGKAHTDEDIESDNLDELVHFIKFWDLDSDDGTCKLEFKPYGYGWEVDVLTTPQSKANYLYQAIIDWYGYDSTEFKFACESISNTLKEYGIDCEFKSLPKYEEDCGIDHFTGMDTAWINKCIFYSKYLLHYLFDNSVVITGNDNSMDFRNLMSLIDEDKCDVYYKGN